MTTRECDNRSVGVIISDAAGRLLMFHRNTFPPGIAPCAGHGDDHGTDEDAARAEVSEELGLSVTSLEPVAAGWRWNVCRRRPGPLGPGHHWRIYRAETRGVLRPSPRETRNAAWLEPAHVQDLATRTVQFARGAISREEFDASPGLEPVWLRWLTEVGTIVLSPQDVDATDWLCTRTPPAIP